MVEPPSEGEINVLIKGHGTVHIIDKRALSEHEILPL